MKLQETKYIKYIKTDKNGTEYYKDYACSRCGGQGYIEHLRHVDNGVCFKCFGRGIADNPRTIKAYTPEYQKKLEAKNIERQKKNILESLEKINKTILRKLGFIDTDELYVYTGDTYKHREEFKNNGARFYKLAGETPAWVCKKYLGELSGTYNMEVTVDDIPKVEGELGLGQYRDIYDLGGVELVNDWLNETYWKDRYNGVTKNQSKK